MAEAVAGDEASGRGSAELTTERPGSPEEAAELLRSLGEAGKVMPTPRLCGEVPGPYRRHPLERDGIAERF